MQTKCQHCNETIKGDPADAAVSHGICDTCWIREHTDNRVILSYGMGVDSTALLLRWLEDPTSRDFELEDLIVITAQVGDEFDSTADLCREHILPRLREAGVRFVQVARSGLLEAEGIDVLEDSREPAGIHIDGVYKLSDELRAAATIPTSGGVRKCSIKYKGWVLDKWIGDELEGREFRHVIGFNSEETRRRDKDQFYGGDTPGRIGWYPLIEWGWSRAKCVDYIREVTGVEWRKSACSFCPFSRGCGEAVGRYVEEPEGAAAALEIEEVALRFNPRMMLFKSKSLRSVIEKSGNAEALELFEARLNALKWTVYRMRRVMLPRKADPSKRGRTERSIVRNNGDDGRAGDMTRAEAEGRIGGRRARVRDTGEGFPRIEEYLVAAPVYVTEKSGRYGVEKFEELLATAEAMLERGSS